MAIKQVYSLQETKLVAGDFKKQLGSFSPSVVLFFASVSHDHSLLNTELQKAFPGAKIFGCSTAGEIVTGKMLSNAVVCMCFDKETIADAHIEVLENIASEDRVPETFKKFETYFKTPIKDMDVSQYVGIILIDGMSGAEERVMDRIGNLTDISFIGGSAGDDLQFKKTFVSSGGKAYSGAAVLALLKPVNGFDFLKTQSFSSTGKKLKATDVDETARTVHAFDGKPAMQAYAQVLGVSLADAGQKFMTNPVGLKVGEEFYVRSPQQPQGQSLRFYCNIKKGMELDVLVSRDIVQDTRIALDAKKKELGLIRGIIDFHCILRTLELRQKNQCDAYGKLFEGIPAIGFSTYGEEFIGHINQTSTMLIFK